MVASSLVKQSGRVGLVIDPREVVSTLLGDRPHLSISTKRGASRFRCLENIT